MEETATHAMRTSPIRDEILLESIEQLRALAHPTRQRILGLLTDDAFTNQQLAATLGEPPSRLHFHLRELEAAGLVTIVEERPKGGVLEKYYRAVARRFRLGGSLGATARDSAERLAEAHLPEGTLDAARQQLTQAVVHYGQLPPDTQIVHQQVHLSSAGLAKIREHLAAIDDDLRRAADTAASDPTAQAFVFTCLLHRLAPADQSDTGGRSEVMP